MKKAFQRIIPILTAVILSLCLALPAFAREINTNRLSLEMKNAPEGTAIIEILVPSEPADDCLCETRGFTVKKKISHYETTQLSDSSGSRPNYSFKSKEDKDIVISKDSEIAKYNDDDGYISLSAHTDGVVETTLNVNTYDDTKAEKNNGIYLQIADKNPASLEDINALKNKFEKFKAAYIDEKGNVLGVTDEFEVTYADEQYAFIRFRKSKAMPKRKQQVDSIAFVQRKQMFRSLTFLLNQERQFLLFIIHTVDGNRPAKKCFR